MNDVEVLVFNCVFGLITAAIAVSKGRSAVGWFLIGFLLSCFGVIFILVMSNLREERARWDRALTEQTRLREQLRQERLKNQAFQQHVQGRLDTHDGALGIDTRPSELEGGSSPPVGYDGDFELVDDGLVGEENSDGRDDAQESPTLSASGLRSRIWYAQVGQGHTDGLSFLELQRLYNNSKISDSSLVWTDGMAEWLPVSAVEGLVQELRP